MKWYWDIAILSLEHLQEFFIYLLHPYFLEKGKKNTLQ